MPRLQSEVDEVLGNKESVSAEDLEKLQYTEQVYVLDSKHFLFIYVAHPIHILSKSEGNNILDDPCSKYILIIIYAICLLL